ncbi:serine hydrolase domain-containing protein [Salsuginibacillus kocurii]|uniref:serine hydrolase domain-containing protein n=1 Tax=Salsuginibacillus kocurii TaxID=427078 RepID=UPI000381B135|nr:serine hydrolase domain-containing protein [Salsuginibacillus kocurii]
MKSWLEERLALLIDHAQSVSVGCTRQGKHSYHAWGQCSTDAPTLPTRYTMYAAGEASQLFTAALIADIVHQGKASWDEPVATYGYEFVRLPSHITLASLTSHTAGLPTWPANRKSPSLTRFSIQAKAYRDEDWIQYLRKTRFDKRMEATYHPSITGYAILGRFLERVWERPFEQVLYDRLLKPLGITEATYSPERYYEEDLAPPEPSKGRKKEVDYWRSFHGAGGMWVSTANWLEFLRSQLGQVPSLAHVKETQLIRHRTMNGGVAHGWQHRSVPSALQDSKPQDFFFYVNKHHKRLNVIGFIPERQSGVVLLANDVPKRTIATVSLEDLVTDLVGAM